MSLILSKGKYMFELNVDSLSQLIGPVNAIGSTKEKLTNLNRIEHSKQGDITFLANNKYEKFLNVTEASCVIVYENLNIKPKDNQVFLQVKNPYEAFLKLVFLFAEKEEFQYGIHPSAVIEKDAVISPKSYIGPNCYISNGVNISDEVIIKSNCSIHKNVTIGKNTIINSNVTIYKDCFIGEDCIIHSGAVIGSDGFGYIDNPDGSYTKIPQIGNVIIGNKVEIGANTTIDRAFVGSTYINDGVKLDNLIQIGHNVEVGVNSAMAAQAGISGSVKIGKRNKIGGQVGVAGHLEIADDVIIYAQSGVPKSVNQSGIYYGSPVREKSLAFQIEAVLNSLPDLYRKINKIIKKFEASENK